MRDDGDHGRRGRRDRPRRRRLPRRGRLERRRAARPLPRHRRHDRQGAAPLSRRERCAGADLGGRGLRAARARPGLAGAGAALRRRPPPPTGASPARRSTTSACTSTTRTTRPPPATSAILADMGMSAQDMGALLDDYDLYPEEILSEVADSVGFGTKFDELARPQPGDRPASARAAGRPRCVRPSPRQRWPPTRRRTHRRRGALAGRRGDRLRAQRPRARRRPDRPRRDRRAARGGRGRRGVAAHRLHPGGHPRAVHDVCRRGGARAGRPRRVRGVRREGRCGRLALGRRTRPPAQPPARGHRGRSRRREHRPAGGVLRPPPRFRRHRATSGSLPRGGVSERPKENASKAFVGASQPRVQIPPPPPAR